MHEAPEQWRMAMCSEGCERVMTPEAAPVVPGGSDPGQRRGRRPVVSGPDFSCKSSTLRLFIRGRLKV